ncbi:hypothetical protein AWC38_SpisGene17660 [Stylophora pistillata]|uniref:Uncharacterized protein n=1 Tax=Stylophora pistillata TaxID=50429 RepID=A0A2B4RP33_STYPI|nr:hypothetical protein AWC38_SpisGene17660 [Stylophora pistillata]
MAGKGNQLKKENQQLRNEIEDLKKQLDKLTEEIGHRREEINHDAGIEHGGDTVGKERSVEFVSAQCDDFEAFKKYASKELKRLSSRLNAKTRDQTATVAVAFVGEEDVVSERIPPPKTPASSRKLGNVKLIERSTERFGISSSLFAECHECGMEEFRATGEHDGDQETPSPAVIEQKNTELFNLMIKA